MSDTFDEAARRFIENIVAINEHHGMGTAPGVYDQAVAEAAAIARKVWTATVLSGPRTGQPWRRGHEGEWIAVKGSTVVASSPDERGLVRMVKALGEGGEGAVVEYVPPPGSTADWSL